jgi:spore coat polysaccharide biosynthesis protein SpsF
VEGPLADVLGRYKIAVDRYNPDYVVRITGDCPLIVPNTIYRIMAMTTQFNYDYVSNVDERFRTSIDGHDTEVMSRRMFEHVAECATQASDREHVTTYIRRNPPIWAKLGLVMEAYDQSQQPKLSVDTQEDLERVRKAFQDGFTKYQEAMRVYGQGKVHRL